VSTIAKFQLSNYTVSRVLLTSAMVKLEFCNGSDYHFCSFISLTTLSSLQSFFHNRSIFAVFLPLEKMKALQLEMYNYYRVVNISYYLFTYLLAVGCQAVPRLRSR